MKECWTIQRLEAQGRGDPICIKLEHGTQEEEGGAFSQAGSSPSMDFSNRNCSSREAGGSCSHPGLPLEGLG